MDTPVSLVLIEWMDSRRPDPGWRHLAAGHDWAPVRCVSVGWLLVDDAERKVLAPNMGDVDDDANMQLCGEITIPTCCVVRITPLAEVSVSSSAPSA